METKFTKGPWQWEMSSSGHVRLATPDRGRLVVMDCVRKGMQRAEPRFAVMDDNQPRGRRGGILRSISELIEDHPSGLLDHPDANLIAASPELYEEHDEWAATFGALVSAVLQRDFGAVDAIVNATKIEFTTDGSPRIASAALAKARGETK